MRIKRGVRYGGRLYRPDNRNDAEELNKVLSKEDAQRLTDMGVIEGISGKGERLRQQPVRTSDDAGTPARAQGVERSVGEKDVKVDRSGTTDYVDTEKQKAERKPNQAGAKPWEPKKGEEPK